MGHVDLNRISFVLPDGRPLLDEVSFRVSDGAVVALVGPNGTGKTTLLRIIAGDLDAHDGAVTRSGGLGVMRQFIGSVRDETTVRDLLLSVAPAPITQAARAVDEAELRILEVDDEPAQLAYAQALADWADVDGYDYETRCDAVTTAALGLPYEQTQHRLAATLSGGEQKRLVLEALLAGPEEVLLLDEPDNYLDVPGKRWLEQKLKETRKTVLLVSHDRELLGEVATRVVTLEPGAAGAISWTHPGSFTTWHEARTRRNEDLEEQRKRWDEEHAKLRGLMLMYKQKAAYNDAMASRYRAAQTRLRRFEDAGPPEKVAREQNVQMRLKGGRTAKRAVICERLELLAPDAMSDADSLMRPFDLEVWYGERVAVLGSNGSGKSYTSCACLPPAVPIPMWSSSPWAMCDRPRFVTKGWHGWDRGCGPAGSRRPTTTIPSTVAPCWRSCTAVTSIGPAARRTRPRGCWTATSWRARPSRPSSRSAAASRPVSRS